jgi:outer membrane protein assembly factor BamE (lipoprotein component of BamABCDE complex)
VRIEKKHVLIFLIISIPVVFFSTIIVSVNFISSYSKPGYYKLFKTVKVGMDESQVVKILGEPEKVYHASTAPVNYYEKYYTHKKRDITNKVFIYPRMEYIAYVYFDHENKVEYVYIGGT